MLSEKSYIEYLQAITPDRVYDGLLGCGLFAEALPPVFTSEAFLEYCKTMDSNFPIKNSPWVVYENIRNNGKSRQIGIPNPFCYERLCGCIRENWSKIVAFFEAHTKAQTYRISQLHIREMKDTRSLLKMNYKSLAERCNPIALKIITEGGFSARYMVETDIAKCFPSIYSHALVWALKGKTWAKKNTDCEIWPNNLDKIVRAVKHGETNGLLIGPHASNLLSEIILTMVDEELCKDYKYIRHIDDVDCYVKTHEEAERFIVDQRKALKKYGLSLNESKTKVHELPNVSEEDWVRRLNDFTSLLPKEKLELPHIRSFLDYVIELAKTAHNDSVISYAMSVIKDRLMTEPARNYYCRTILHFASLHPYLYRFLDKYLFAPFSPELKVIKSFSVRMLEHGMQVHNYEEVSYSIYFSIRYGVRLDGIKLESILSINDCVLSVMALLYVRYWNEDETLLRNKALKLVSDENEMWENWLFVYEVLSREELKAVTKFKDEVLAIKKKKISFLVGEEKISATYSRNWETRYTKWHWSLVSLSKVATDKMEVLRAALKRDVPHVGEKHIEYLDMLVANMFVGRVLRYNIAIPKSKTAYLRCNLLDSKNEDIDGEKIKDIVKWLCDKGYVGERVGAKGEGVSYYWARNRFSELFDAINLSNICTVSLKDVSKPPVILKDSGNKEVNVDENVEKREWYINRLNSINHFYAGNNITFLPGCGMRRQSLHPKLVAIFNNSDWNQGGRLYAHERFFGINYQCLSSERRATIEISNYPIVERDYSGLHVVMLYAQEGCQYNGDPYAVVENKFRPLAKAAMLRLLNADSRESAVVSVRNQYEELKDVAGLSQRKIALLQAFEECEDIEKIFLQLEKAHEKIAKYFYTGIGLKLQSIDSQMALDIVSYFSDKGIVALPVHDSFIIQKKYDEELVAKMKEVYSKYNNGFSCDVK